MSRRILLGVAFCLVLFTPLAAAQDTCMWFPSPNQVVCQAGSPASCAVNAADYGVAFGTWAVKYGECTVLGPG